VKLATRRKVANGRPRRSNAKRPFWVNVKKLFRLLRILKESCVVFGFTDFFWDEKRFGFYDFNLTSGGYATYWTGASLYPYFVSSLL
jgi:hypothetical protein